MTALVHLKQVAATEIPRFREMVEQYWQELMPHAPVVKDAARRDAYFRERFAWAGGNRHPHWIVAHDCRVGFVMFEVAGEKRRAGVSDFYIVPGERRKGRGTAAVQRLFALFDKRGVEQIDVHVRRDNPAAPAFWQAQGFDIALYVMRQYRDPETGTAFVGVLSSEFCDSRRSLNKE